MDSEMRTNIHDVYAAGDVCTIHWDPWPQMWFQVPSAVCLLCSLLFSSSSLCKIELYASFCFRCVSGLRPDKWVPMQQGAWWLMQVSEVGQVR